MAQGSRLTVEERGRIAELAATGLPSRLIGRELGRSHRAVWAYVVKLRQPPPRERRRSPLRLSLVEREEISRGLAGGESLEREAGPHEEPDPPPLHVARCEADHLVRQPGHDRDQDDP